MRQEYGHPNGMLPECREFEQQVLSDLAILRTQMSTLVGNGQPGRIRELEIRVEKHEKLVQRCMGFLGLLTALSTYLGWK